MTQNLIQYAKLWLIKANEDINATLALSNLGIEMYANTICFHCQQSVEKFLKAFLVVHGVNFKKTHDVDYLLAKCMEINQQLFEDINLKELTEYGVNIRYPGDMMQPALSETKQYIEITKQIKNIIEPYIKKQIKENQ